MTEFRNNLNINLDITRTCTLQCPACFRQTDMFGKLKPLYQDMTMDDFIKISNYFKHIEFCGTIGDPTFHKDFISMLKICYEKGISTKIATSASHKSKSWYIEAFNANPNAFWVFGIDGLPKDSHKYRVNQDGEKLFDIMVEAKRLGLKIEWQYLIFSYNENNIEESKQLALKHNIDIQVFKTKRHGPGLTPSYENVNDTSTNINAKSILPRCLTGRDLGHSAMGYITPCCWFGDVNVEEKYPDLCNESTKISNVNKIEDIFNSNGWKKYQNILSYKQDKAYPLCWNKCGTGYKPSKVQK